MVENWLTPILIDRVQDSEGNTIVNNEKRSCVNCDQISFHKHRLSQGYKDNYEASIFSTNCIPSNVYFRRSYSSWNRKKTYVNLKLNLAGKTGTTNENTDTWFIGFTSNLVIGVYVGMDNPKPLGKFETGSKVALPIFESFVKNAIKKSDARPFKASDGITMMVVDPLSGQKAKFSSKDTIIESYKKKNVIDGKVLYLNNDRLDSNNVLKFY